MPIKTPSSLFLPLAAPPGSGNQFLSLLLSRCGVSAPPVHNVERIRGHASNGCQGFLVMARDWAASVSSTDPARGPGSRPGASKWLTTYHATDGDIARQRAYQELLGAVWSTGLPWRFVTYESLILHPEGTLEATLAFCGVSAALAQRLAWSETTWNGRSYPVNGNKRRHPRTVRGLDYTGLPGFELPGDSQP